MNSALLGWATVLAALCAIAPSASANEVPRFSIEAEGGAVWQGRNDVQIPNDMTGTRFSIRDVTGDGPWPYGRLYLSWNVNRKHGVRALLAPLTIQESGEIEANVDFAGATYAPGSPVEATYKFNSWRLTYRYLFSESASLRWWVGFSAKLRDAKVKLSQGATTSRDTDFGFVPLLHLAADWEWAPDWRLLFDFDGLAGGPGRAFDVSLKVRRDVTDRLGMGIGYRTLEGGADVDSVYNFAWLHYVAASATYRF